MRFVRNFPTTLATSCAGEGVREHWAANGEPERLLLSFHGVPRRSLDLGDYHCECHKTGRLVAEDIGVAREGAMLVVPVARAAEQNGSNPTPSPPWNSSPPRACAAST